MNRHRRFIHTNNKEKADLLELLFTLWIYICYNKGTACWALRSINDFRDSNRAQKRGSLDGQAHHSKSEYSCCCCCYCTRWKHFQWQPGFDFHLSSSFQVTLLLIISPWTHYSPFHERLAESNKTIESPPPVVVQYRTARSLTAKGDNSQFVKIHFSSCLIRYTIGRNQTRKRLDTSATIFSFRKRWWPGRFRPTCSPPLKTFLSFLLFVLCQYLTMG